MIKDEVLTYSAMAPALHPGDRLVVNEKRRIVIHPIDHHSVRIRPPTFWEWLRWALDDRLQIIERWLRRQWDVLERDVQDACRKLEKWMENHGG
jgi:hypothetical protein